MIVSCKECQGSVSDRASRCPHCGAGQIPFLRPVAIGLVVSWLLLFGGLDWIGERVLTPLGVLFGCLGLAVMMVVASLLAKPRRSKA
jgi:hypothetical protein